MSQQFPSVGELVVATCTKVTDHGAYFSIFDYEHLGEEAGFIHVSELSKTWVRNIRSEIREGRSQMVKVSIEVRNGACRFRVAVQAESIRQAVRIVGRRYPAGDVRVRFPLDSEDSFAKNTAARAGIAA